MEKHSTKRERNCVRIHVCMIFTIFFFLFFFEAPRYLPLDQCLGHLFLKRSIHARVYDLHAGEVERVDWYGNKPVARNSFFFFFASLLAVGRRWRTRNRRPSSKCLAKYFMRSMGSSRIYASGREGAPLPRKKPRGFPNRRADCLRFDLYLPGSG